MNKKIIQDILKKITAGDEKAALKLLKEHPLMLTYFAQEYTGRLSKRDSRDFKANALMIALKNNCLGVAKELIKAGATINFKDKAGRTALMIACQHGHHAMVKVLLKEGAKVNAVDNDGLSALIYAIGGEADRTDVLPVIKTLLQAGADPNLKEANALAYANYDWEQASDKDKDKIINLLIKFGAKDDDPDVIDLDEFVLMFEPEKKG